MNETQSLSLKSLGLHMESQHMTSAVITIADLEGSSCSQGKGESDHFNLDWVNWVGVDRKSEKPFAQEVNLDRAFSA